MTTEDRQHPLARQPDPRALLKRLRRLEDYARALERKQVSDPQGGWENRITWNERQITRARSAFEAACQDAGIVWEMKPGDWVRLRGVEEHVQVTTVGVTTFRYRWVSGQAGGPSPRLNVIERVEELEPRSEPQIAAGGNDRDQSPQDPPHISLIANQELLTAHQAAKLIGVKPGTFNYHVRRGHIPIAAIISDRIKLIAKADVERFARKFKSHQELTESFDWLSDDE